MCPRVPIVARRSGPVQGTGAWPRASCRRAQVLTHLQAGKTLNPACTSGLRTETQLLRDRLVPACVCGQQVATAGP